MKRKVLFMGILVVLTLVGFVSPKVVMADTGYPPYDYKSATIKSLTDEETFSVDVEWGEFEYEYVNNSWRALPSSYDLYQNSNYVKVTNRTRHPISAGIYFTSNIYGLDAGIGVSVEREGFGTCVDARNKILYSNAWSNNNQNGGYVFKANPSDVVIYRDNKCEVQVEAGEAYDSTRNYYYAKSNLQFIGDPGTSYSSEVIDGTIYSNNVVGSQYNPTELAESVVYNVYLMGGDYSSIQGIYNTNKKLGTINLWIYSGD